LRKLLVVAAVLLVAGAAAAAPKEKVKLERKTRAGQWLAVKERQRTETKVSWKSGGIGSTGDEVEETEREYDRKVVTEKPLVEKRSYHVSRRLKRTAKTPDAEPQNTSVHGKTVLIGPDGMKIEGGAEMSKDDRDNLTTLERVVYACLPAKEVAPGDDWKVDGAELGRAVFGPAIDPVNFDTQGIGKLDKVATGKDGRKTAKIVLRVAIKVKPTEVLPEIDMDLRGQAQFSIDDGLFTAFDLEGPVKFAFHKREDDGRETNAKSEGTTRFVYRAEVLLGDKELGPADKPEAKGSPKDAALALAKKLVDKNGHQFPVGFLNCGICGAKVDEATKLCPKGCPFILRHCPLCGEELAPAGE
jgi:hypothetical protein